MCCESQHFEKKSGHANRPAKNHLNLSPLINVAIYSDQLTFLPCLKNKCEYYCYNTLNQQQKGVASFPHHYAHKSADACCGDDNGLGSRLLYPLDLHTYIPYRTLNDTGGINKLANKQINKLGTNLILIFTSDIRRWRCNILRISIALETLSNWFQSQHIMTNLTIVYIVCNLLIYTPNEEGGMFHC